MAVHMTEVYQVAEKVTFAYGSRFLAKFVAVHMAKPPLIYYDEKYCYFMVVLKNIFKLSM